MTVKLSDDYTGWQDATECVVPLFEYEDGGVKLHGEGKAQKTMYSQEKVSALKISLNDCIYCSGCITSAEEVFISTSNVDKLKELLGTEYSMLMLTSQSVISLQLALQYITDSQVTRGQLWGLIADQFPRAQVYHESQYIQLAVNQLVDDAVRYVHSRGSNGPIMITHCPSVRMFINKKQDSFNQFLNSSCSSYEAFYQLHQDDPRPKVVITSCQDRKLEAFKYDGCYSFTAGEFLSIMDVQRLGAPQGPCDVDGEAFTSYKDVAVSLHAALGAEYSPRKGVNRDQQLSSFVADGAEFAVVCNQGVRNLENMCRKARAIGGQTRTIYVLEACPAGCCGGGGLAAADRAQLPAVSQRVGELAAGGPVRYQPVAQGELRKTRVEQTRVLSPEEILRRRGVDAARAVRLGDMEW